MLDFYMLDFLYTSIESKVISFIRGVPKCIFNKILVTCVVVDDDANYINTKDIFLCTFFYLKAFQKF